MRRAAVTVTTAMALALGVSPAARALDTGGTTTVDRPASGLPFDGVAHASFSSRRAISDDGRYVAFSSQSDAILGLLPSAIGGVYRKDLQTGDVVLVSRRDDEAPTLGTQGDPSISADGNLVAFATSDGADPADSNGESDIYVRNISAGTTTLVSCVMGAGCAVQAGQGSFQPSISGDGSTVAWQTPGDMTDATINDTDTRLDVYARRGTTTFLISVNDDGNHDNSPAASATEADVNGDGTSVAFESDRALVVNGATTDANGNNDVFVRTGLGGVTHTYLASRTSANVAIGGADPSISDGGSPLVAFDTSANIGADSDGDGDVYTQNATSAATDPTLVSAVDGTIAGDGDGHASQASISADAATVAFASTATNLNTDDTDGAADIFVRNGTTTTLVHRADGAAGTAGGGPAQRPSLARDASATAMLTPAALNAGDGALNDVYVRAGASTTWASAPTSGPTVLQAGSGRLSTNGQRVSSDGRFVLFLSAAPALSAAGTTGVFRRDLATGEVVRVDVSSAGTAGNANAGQASMSGDGSKIVFVSTATNLVDGDANAKQDAFVRDLGAGTTTIAATDPNGTFEPAIAGSGSRIAFTTGVALDAAADTNGSVFDVYVKDLATGAFTLVSRADGASGVVSANGGGAPSLSDDGNRVLFQTDSTNLPDGDATYDAYVRDIAAGRTFVASRTAGGGEPDQGINDALLSGDGLRVAFETSATNLGDGDADGNGDVHVRTLADGTLTWATRGIGGAPLDQSVGDFELSRDGRLVLFVAGATNADPADASTDDDAFIRDLAAGTTVLAARAADGTSPVGDVFEAAMSPDGGCVAFSTQATGIDPAGYPSADYIHVYLHARTRSCPATAAGPAPPGPPAGPAPLTPDKTAPKITNLKVTTARKRRITIRFKVSEAARITLKVQREVRGTRRGTRCVKRRRTGKRCTRLITVGTVTRTVKKAGTVTVVLRGKVGKKRLAVSKHRVTLQARDTAGNRSKAVAKRFAVRR